MQFFQIVLCCVHVCQRVPRQLKDSKPNHTCPIDAQTMSNTLCEHCTCIYTFAHSLIHMRALSCSYTHKHAHSHARIRYESNRPRAVLFEGPPGTGKTLTARILARRCGRPMVHVAVEKIVSKVCVGGGFYIRASVCYLYWSVQMLKIALTYLLTHATTPTSGTENRPKICRLSLTPAKNSTP